MKVNQQHRRTRRSSGGFVESRSYFRGGESGSERGTTVTSRQLFFHICLQGTKRLRCLALLRPPMHMEHSSSPGPTPLQHLYSWETLMEHNCITVRRQGPERAPEPGHPTEGRIIPPPAPHLHHSAAVPTPHIRTVKRKQQSLIILLPC